MLSYQPSPIESSLSILIADDNKVILELLSQVFEKKGFKVFKSENGLDAWHIFNGEHIDFVLTDIHMPGLNGKELSHRIRNQSKLTKIGVMTGGEDNIALELLKDGTADYFFAKPLDINIICRSLMEDAQIA